MDDDEDKRDQDLRKTHEKREHWSRGDDSWWKGQWLPLDCNGDQLKCKSTLTHLGYQQKYGIDYGETLAPVFLNGTTQLLFCVPAAWRIKPKKGDVTYVLQTTEFKDSTISMSIFEGFGFLYPEIGKHNCCLMWHNAINGLKQSRNAFTKISSPCCWLGIPAIPKQNGWYVIRKITDHCIHDGVAEDLDGGRLEPSLWLQVHFKMVEEKSGPASWIHLDSLHACQILIDYLDIHYLSRPWSIGQFPVRNDEDGEGVRRAVLKSTGVSWLLRMDRLR